MEYKSAPTAVKEIKGRTVTGIFAVHGNIDSYDDVSHPGSFTKTLQDRQGKIRFLWNHDYWAGPPVAVIKSIREVTRDELPEAILIRAPEATGGVEVTREYLDTARGDEVFKAVASGALDEMSYGYDPVKFDFAELNDVRVRNLREVRLWEVSDVLWGANDATVASKFLPPIDVLLKQLERALQGQQGKAGARHSASDVKLLNAIHKAAVELGATSCKGTVDEDEDEPENDTDGEKSRADAHLTSLTLIRAGQFLLEV